MDQRTARLGNERIGKLLWTFSIPAITGMVVSSLYTLIDRAFLGNVVGPDAIAGISLSMPISFLIMAFGMLVSVGSGAMVSIRLGQKQKDQAELILGNALTVTLIVAVVLTFLFLIFLDPLLRAFGASANTLPYAQQFMRVILLGSVVQYVGFGLNAIIRAEGNPRLAMMTMFINAGLNIVLDVLFIWMLRLGVTGAAVATVISQTVSAVWTVAHFMSKRSVLRLHMANLAPRWSVIRPSLAIGLAPFSMYFVMSIVSLVINRSLSQLGGDVAVSAYGVIGALSMLILMPILGLSQGAQPIVGFNFGALHIDRVKRTLKLAIVAATIISCVGFVFAEVFPGPLMSVFSRDPKLIEIGQRALRICFAAFPLLGYGVIVGTFFQAVGRAKTALFLTLLRQVFVLIPLLLLLPRRFGLDGVWAAGPIADLVSSLGTTAALIYQLRVLSRSQHEPLVAPTPDTDSAVA